MVTCAAILEQMTSRARLKISFQAHFYDDVPTPQPVSMLAGTPVHRNQQPVSMVSRTPVLRNQSRFKSANEKRRKAAPTEYTGPPSKQPKRSATGGKRCRLCKQRQHQVQRCPLILPFSGRWLTQRQPHVSKAQRSALAANLSDPLVYTTGSRSSLQKKCDVFTSLPKLGMDGALIIHRRVYDDMNHPQKESAINYCFECTVFTQGGVRVAEYDYGLFACAPIAEHITRSKSSLIMSLLVASSGMRSLLTSTQPTQDSGDEESTAGDSTAGGSMISKSTAGESQMLPNNPGTSSGMRSLPMSTQPTQDSVPDAA
jgi:hypothetical protein